MIPRPQKNVWIIYCARKRNSKLWTGQSVSGFYSFWKRLRHLFGRELSVGRVFSWAIPRGIIPAPFGRVPIGWWSWSNERRNGPERIEIIMCYHYRWQRSSEGVGVVATFKNIWKKYKVFRSSLNADAFCIPCKLATTKALCNHSLAFIIAECLEFQSEHLWAFRKKTVRSNLLKKLEWEWELQIPIPSELIHDPFGSPCCIICHIVRMRSWTHCRTLTTSQFGRLLNEQGYLLHKLVPPITAYLQLEGACKTALA